VRVQPEADHCDWEGKVNHWLKDSKGVLRRDKAGRRMMKYNTCQGLDKNQNPIERRCGKLVKGKMKIYPRGPGCDVLKRNNAKNVKSYAIAKKPKSKSFDMRLTDELSKKSTNPIKPTNPTEPYNMDGQVLRPVMQSNIQSTVPSTLNGLGSLGFSNVDNFGSLGSLGNTPQFSNHSNHSKQSKHSKKLKHSLDIHIPSKVNSLSSLGMQPTQDFIQPIQDRDEEYDEMGSLLDDVSPIDEEQLDAWKDQSI